MPRVNQPDARINPHGQFPERLRAVRSGSAYVVEGGNVLTPSEQRAGWPSHRWRPGEAIPKGATASGVSALERNADEAARRGVFANDRREGRRAA